MASEASAFAPFEFERWCAAYVPAAGCDLSPSGAPPLRLDELLAFATASERDAFAAVPLGYGPASGDPELRRLVARRHGVRAHEVLVTCGAIEALLCVVSALVRAGDEVVVQQPMYPAVAGIARGLGATVVPWRLAAADGFRPRIAALARLLSPRTRLVAVTQPNGPTGSVLEEDDLAAPATATNAVTPARGRTNESAPSREARSARSEMFARALRMGRASNASACRSATAASMLEGVGAESVV